jgi:hypothetical protein
VLGLVLVVPQCAVMVVISVPDGRLVEGGLIQGSVHLPEPSQRRNGLREDNDQRKHVRSHGTSRPAIEQEVHMERPS